MKIRWTDTHTDLLLSPIYSFSLFFSPKHSLRELCMSLSLSVCLSLYMLCLHDKMVDWRWEKVCQLLINCRDFKTTPYCAANMNYTAYTDTVCIYYKWMSHSLYRGEAWKLLMAHVTHTICSLQYAESNILTIQRSLYYPVLYISSWTTGHHSDFNSVCLGKLQVIILIL